MKIKNRKYSNSKKESTINCLTNLVFFINRNKCLTTFKIINILLDLI